VGTSGWVLIVALVDGAEVHPEDINVTVNVYVLADNPEKVAVGEEPVMVAPPGIAVTVHDDDGNPLKATLPVAVEQVGCVIVPTIGADGVTGWALIEASVDDVDVHPEEVSVTVKV